MAQLGNVNIDGLSLSAGMKADLSAGMSVAQFNSKYAGPGFTAINGNRQVGAAAAAPAAPNYAANDAARNNSFQDAINQQNAAMNALLDRQKQEQEGLFGQYETAINGQEKLPALYTRLSNELGIPGLSNQVQGYKNDIYRVQGLLDRLDEDVTSRTLGTLTSEGARNAIVGKEGSALNTQISRLGTGMQPLVDLLTGAQGQLNTMMPLYVQQQSKELQPLEMRINALGDRFAREMTGFNANRESTLNGLMDKLNRERQLDDREWQLAQDLAAEARAFERQKALASSAAASYLQSNAAPAQSSSNSIRSLPTYSSPQITSVGVLANPGTITSVGTAKNVGTIGSVGVARNVGTLGSGW